MQNIDGGGSEAAPKTFPAVATAPRRGPRFVLLTARGPVIRSTAVSGDEQHWPGAFAWRLDAGNNRAVGRAESTTPDQISCLIAVRRVHDGTRRLAETVTYAQSHGLWTWRAVLDAGTDAGTGIGPDVAGEPTVSVSAHRYARRVECARAFEQFLEAAMTAEPDAVVIRSFGPRTLRAFAGATR